MLLLDQLQIQLLDWSHILLQVGKRKWVRKSFFWEEMDEEKFMLGEPLSFYSFHLTRFYIFNFQLKFFISWAFLATTELLNTAKQLEVSLTEVEDQLRMSRHKIFVTTLMGISSFR